MEYIELTSYSASVARRALKVLIAEQTKLYQELESAPEVDTPLSSSRLLQVMGDQIEDMKRALRDLTPAEGRVDL